MRSCAYSTGETLRGYTGCYMRQESVMQSANFKGMANMYLRASRGGTEPCGGRGRMTKRSGIGSCWVEKGKSEGAEAGDLI